MGKQKDKKNRNELKDIIRKSNLSEALKSKLLLYAEELENGILQKTLDDIKEKLS